MINKIHKYWELPDDRNKAENYFHGIERSKYLYTHVKSLKLSNPKILELGCNVGRNMNYLYNKGFKNIEGVDISERAIELGRERYPHLKYHVGKIEHFLKNNKQYDIIYTMAVLEHICNDSEFIFEEMVRFTKYIVCIEDETSVSWRHFKRNYKDVFENLGMEQIHAEDCEGIEKLGKKFYLRIFKK